MCNDCVFASSDSCILYVLVLINHWNVYLDHTTFLHLRMLFVVTIILIRICTYVHMHVFLIRIDTYMYTHMYINISHFVIFSQKWQHWTLCIIKYNRYRQNIIDCHTTKSEQKHHTSDHKQKLYATMSYQKWCALTLGHY